MGYYSTVTVLFHKKKLTKENQEEIKESVNKIYMTSEWYAGKTTCFNFDEDYNENTIKIEWEYVKWGYCDKEQKILDDLFNKFPEDSYTFIRQGESIDDLEIEGNENAVKIYFNFDSFGINPLSFDRCWQELEKFNNGFYRTKYGLVLDLEESKISLEKIKRKIMGIDKYAFIKEINNEFILITTYDCLIFNEIKNSDIVLNTFYIEDGEREVENEASNQEIYIDYDIIEIDN